MAPLDVSADRVVEVYRALRKLAALTRDARYRVCLRLEAGDLMMFDNRRVLHGRDAFRPATGRRHLQGCYVDHDEVLSRIRVLERDHREG